MTDTDMYDDVSLYANLFGYLGCPLSDDPLQDTADVAILGVPYDLGTSGRAGTRSGPGAIRQASGNLRWEEARWPWPYALADHLKVIDCGDLAYAPGDSAGFTQSLQDRATDILRSGKTLLSFGGDHFITLPLLRAHHAVHGELALVHFDAHTDTYEQGSEFDHGTMFRRAPREGLIDTDCSIQVGIRTEYEPSTHAFAVLDTDWVHNHGPVKVAQAIRDRVAKRKVYLTFDIDCLDPAFAPGTGTPVAGGLSSNMALQILRGLKGLDIVGM
ncbi:MAG: agmatinase, partial [Arenicellales bacterium]|nr:agmatinase [Arenicellales bacterium]